jgi:hypothetical protein
VNVDGEVGGRPDEPVPFDPGDGPVDLVRRVHLRTEIRRLRLGGGGLVAWGAGLALTIRRMDREEGLGAHRIVSGRFPDGEAGLRTDARGRLEAGGWTVLPQTLGEYESNHEMGEVFTGFDVVRDGVLLHLAPGRPFDRLLVDVRERPTWRPHRIKADVSPRRPASLRTLGLARRSTSRSFFLEPVEGLRFESPEGSPLPYTVQVGGDS